MSYRDDLNAAHQRIAALEQELARQAKKPQMPPPTPTKQAFEPFDDGMARLLDTPSYQAMLMSRFAAARPVVQSMRSLKKQTVPITFSCSGEAGTVAVAAHRSQQLFKGTELFAFDTSQRPGHGTVIAGAYVGQINQFENVPTWMFYEWLPPEERAAYEVAAKLVGTPLETAEVRSAAARLRLANAAMKLTWTTCQPALDMVFQVRFLETCKWEAVLWGDVLR